MQHNYELQLAAIVLDTRRRRGRRIALTATRGKLGEVGEGLRLTLPCFRRSGTGTIRRWCRFRLLRRSHPPPCRRDLRNRPNTKETSQAHPRPRASKTTCGSRETERRRRRARGGARRSSHHRREAPDVDAAGAPSISCEAPPLPPSPLAAVCRTATRRPSESSGVDDGSGRFWAGIWRPGGRPPNPPRRLRRRSLASREAPGGEGRESVGRRVGVELRGGGREACGAEGERTGEKREETPRRVRVVLSLCVRACVVWGRSLARSLVV